MQLRKLIVLKGLSFNSHVQFEEVHALHSACSLIGSEVTRSISCLQPATSVDLSNWTEKAQS